MDGVTYYPQLQNYHFSHFNGLNQQFIILILFKLNCTYFMKTAPLNTHPKDGILVFSLKNSIQFKSGCEFQTID